MANILLTISIVLPLIGPIIYIYEILYKGVKPNRMTRLIFLILGILTTASLFAQESRISIWLSVASLFQAILVFLVSIKHGEGGTNKLDILVFIIAMLGIVAWKLTNNPLWALIFSIVADFAGVVPTLVKSYKKPHEESYIFYGLDTIASLFNLLALFLLSGTIFSFDAIYSSYLFVINGLVASIILVRGKYS